MSAIIEKAKANPVMTAVIAFVTLASGVSAAWNAGEFIDSVHTTNMELVEYVAESHPVSSKAFDKLTERMTAAQVANKCRWLKSEIRALKDSLYQRRRDNGDPDYINQLVNDLADMEAEYSALNCVRLLA